MTRTLYLNGAWLPESEAKVSVFDRGFLMADGIYEVTCVLDGKLVDYAGHAARLQRSAQELGMALPLTEAELLEVHREIVARNALDQGLIYLQLTRGVAERDFVYPPAGTPPTLVMFTQAKNVLENAAAEAGIRVALLPDLRWGRRDIKTVQLLYPCMAKMEAKARGADDAWLVEDGFVTEGSAATSHIVTAEGVLVTRDLSHALLPGITRASVLELAAAHGVRVEERAFTPDEARAAREAFITSATNFVVPVVAIDGATVGDGKPGALTRDLRRFYIETRRASAI
ncbi:D-amino-acid transaminase [Rhodobacter sphaeroides]|jgi:D-alanine transaminase|uniref:Probable branched-chain-amino-acid aminotransferase n=2 Tax=Cereibacter TaxID=1653176 RepID=Q3IWM5_CERS4|nr:MULTISPECIES: D-amino-acid transaminase [Cereibacter]ABA81059.1 D-alanine aminotransferase [Cereibacter sphaeroides 2.4.1]ACM03481.1 Aminotransferase, class IV [Cereibacter sphaeroides KD131]AMJ49374.1 D-amino acid aminotransferase [Cereibacter sphaeroides]ANS36082.1 D-amino acid aminotransferase [Cereibacter sphaeroides]ATN65147.1 D-amino acid aminotransferase [Cereibacter sphaeroides]